MRAFQSPRGDFGFLKRDQIGKLFPTVDISMFQSPRGDFGFLKLCEYLQCDVSDILRFNPLAGILVF